MFRCRPEVVNGQQVLAVDATIPCQTSAHTLAVVFAAVCALIYNVTVPLLLVAFLFRYKRKLASASLISKYGFLYQGYSIERSKYWWEVIHLLRKWLLLFIAGVFNDPWYQALSGIAVLTVALGLHLSYRPYARHTYNRLETAGLLVLMTTQLCTMVLYRAGGSQEESSTLGTIITLFLTGLNGAYLLVLVTLFFRFTALGKMQKRQAAALRKASVNGAQQGLELPSKQSAEGHSLRFGGHSQGEGAEEEDKSEDGAIFTVSPLFSSSLLQRNAMADSKADRAEFPSLPPLQQQHGTGLDRSANSMVSSSVVFANPTQPSQSSTATATPPPSSLRHSKLIQVLRQRLNQGT